ncbi:MAG TPA: hypothetical protein PKJ24_04495, partial [Prolixibacteraceae bacterium]|nr:hypothetical protein [Prolixibacteraceae bacterium]
HAGAGVYKEAGGGKERSVLILMPIRTKAQAFWLMVYPRHECRGWHGFQLLTITLKMPGLAWQIIILPTPAFMLGV